MDVVCPNCSDDCPNYKNCVSMTLDLIVSITKDYTSEKITKALEQSKGTELSQAIYQIAFLRDEHMFAFKKKVELKQRRHRNVE